MNILITIKLQDTVVQKVKKVHQKNAIAIVMIFQEQWPKMIC